MPQGERTLELLSIVAPVYDEEETVRAFHERVSAAVADLPFELIIVDDGSTDSTARILFELSAADSRLKVVTLSRNFGQQAALTAGLEHAAGDPVVMLDADLQDPPEVIPLLVEQWRRGSDVVYAVRAGRAGESAFKLRTARWFYSIFSRLAQIKIEQDAGGFRLLGRRPLEAVLRMPERSRWVWGMTVWVGFTQSALYYERDARQAGKTKYGFLQLFRVASDALVSFSIVPLQLATLLGLFISAVALLAVPVYIGLRVGGHYVPGFTTLSIIVLLLGGVQLITLGIMGEYLGRVYDEVKRRPIYVVQERRNFDADALPARATHEVVES